MATVTGSLGVSAKMSWGQTKTVTGFSTLTLTDSNSFVAAPSAATYNEIKAYQTTIAASANETVDFYSMTNTFGDAKTVTKILGWLIKATGNTGQLKIEPGASNALTWFFSGTTPAITLNCGADGCALLVMDGSVATVSNSVKNVKFSNPGSATITVTISAFVGT